MLRLRLVGEPELPTLLWLPVVVVGVAVWRRGVVAGVVELRGAPVLPELDLACEDEMPK